MVLDHRAWCWVSPGVLAHLPALTPWGTSGEGNSASLQCVRCAPPPPWYGSLGGSWLERG